MKITYTLLGIFLVIGATDNTWAKEVSLGPGVPLSAVRVGTPTFSKKANKTEPNSSSIVKPGAWYRYCPVRHNIVLTSKNAAEVTLSNGKRILLSNRALKAVVEADLKKYEPFMY